jgi:hypothetical protein
MMSTWFSHKNWVWHLSLQDRCALPRRPTLGEATWPHSSHRTLFFRWERHRRWCTLIPLSPCSSLATTPSRPYQADALHLSHARGSCVGAPRPPTSSWRARRPGHSAWQGRAPTRLASQLGWLDRMHGPVQSLSLLRWWAAQPASWPSSVWFRPECRTQIKNSFFLFTLFQICFKLKKFVSNSILVQNSLNQFHYSSKFIFYPRKT